MEHRIDEITAQWDGWIADYGVERLPDRLAEVSKQVDQGDGFFETLSFLFQPLKLKPLRHLPNKHYMTLTKSAKSKTCEKVY